MVSLATVTLLQDKIKKQVFSLGIFPFPIVFYICYLTHLRVPNIRNDEIQRRQYVNLHIASVSSTLFNLVGYNCESKMCLDRDYQHYVSNTK